MALCDNNRCGHVTPLETIIGLKSRHAQRKAKLVMGDCLWAVDLHSRAL
jgi:hypothetical protein